MKHIIPSQSGSYKANIYCTIPPNFLHMILQVGRALAQTTVTDLHIDRAVRFTYDSKLSRSCTRRGRCCAGKRTSSRRRSCSRHRSCRLRHRSCRLSRRLHPGRHWRRSTPFTPLGSLLSLRWGRLAYHHHNFPLLSRLWGQLACRRPRSCRRPWIFPWTRISWTCRRKGRVSFTLSVLTAYRITI
jgi:hypothetical protein